MLHDSLLFFGVQQIYLANLQWVKFYRIAFIEISIFGSNKPVTYAILPNRNLTGIDTF